MTRRTVLCLVLGALSTPFAAGAQPASTIPVVGYVALPDEPVEVRRQGGFIRGLQDLGNVPGQTVVVQTRTYTTSDELRRVLAEFVHQQVDVIFVGTPPVARSARQSTRTIPIVCGSCGNPVENGLAASLARPGGNVTGMASLSAELIGKRLELMKELLPGLSRMAVFVFPANPGTRATARALDAAARIAQLGLQQRLPVVTGVAEIAESGALMAYGPDRVDLYRRAAGFVDKILRGARPQDLPFEQATMLHLVLNLRTARGLGVAVPSSLLLRADRIIE